jgi:hypothetical protein
MMALVPGVLICPVILWPCIADHLAFVSGCREHPGVVLMGQGVGDCRLLVPTFCGSDICWATIILAIADQWLIVCGLRQFPVITSRDTATDMRCRSTLRNDMGCGTALLIVIGFA